MAATAGPDGGGGGVGAAAAAAASSSSSSSSSPRNGEDGGKDAFEDASSKQWTFDFGSGSMTEFSVDDPNPWRDEIVRTIFGDVGAIRRDFSCAIERKILLHGRLYVTDRFICFYSNLFGFEKKIKIPYSYITCITKEYTAVFIPNAIAVITARKEYIFRSFWDRDECYEVLRSMHDKFRGVVEGSHVEEEEEGGSAMQNFFAEGSQSLVAEEEVLEPVISVDESGVPDEDAVEEFAIERAESAIKHRAQPEKQLPKEDAESTGSMISLGSITSLGALAHELNSTNLSISIDGFFTHFLADDAPFSLAKFHEFQGDEEVANTPWATSQWNEKESEQTREIRFVRRLNSPIGPSSTRTTKMQRCRQFGTRGIVVNTVMSMEDIPYRDCFTIEDRWVAEPVDPETTRVRFEFQVVWSKTTIWKRRIEYSSKQDLEKFYEAYVHAAHTYLDELQSSSSSSATNVVEDGAQIVKDLAPSAPPQTEQSLLAVAAIPNGDAERGRTTNADMDPRTVLTNSVAAVEQAMARAADGAFSAMASVSLQQAHQETIRSTTAAVASVTSSSSSSTHSRPVDDQKKVVEKTLRRKVDEETTTASSQLASVLFSFIYTHRLPLLCILFSLLFVTHLKQQAALVELAKAQRQILAEIAALSDQVKTLSAAETQ